MRPPRSKDNRVNQMAGHLAELGWEYLRVSGGHLVFTHPKYGKTQLPYSPSETQRWFHNKLSELAKQIGCTTLELKVRLGLSQPRRKGPKVRRQRNEAGVKARSFAAPTKQFKPGPERVGTLAERRKEIADEIGAVAQALNYAQGDEYDSLLEEHTRLRGEYCQLTHEMAKTA